MNYTIEGAPLPIAICELEQGEQIIVEHGRMSWMSPNMKMDTTTNGGIGKGLKRSAVGEKMFQNRYTSGGGRGTIAFSPRSPGAVKVFEISPATDMIVQKSGFLASETSVELSVYMHKKFGTGMFGGEGFFMQRLSGRGTAFVEMDGHVSVYDLQPGQKVIVSTGHLAAMESSCRLDIQKVPGAKNVAFGGEGFFNTVITGPGRVWLQSMKMSRAVG